ncbi:hypothetical protein N752_21635 [Desulforamulus aquiferis]|nr:stalk domain-containing protein [Desulforamulus aquiferis]RYD03015.1 hypothetical protein N752_21635 [Desulforamulus aquiferis]
MKKLALVLCLFISTVFFPGTSFADSPITSTDFFKAYLNVDIVSRAADIKIVDTEIATYLASPDHPIDTKAAVINAIGWDANAKNNADRYANIVYGKSVNELNLETLSGEELFNIGYLMAMDNYFDTAKASDLLQRAKAKLSNSFTVSIVAAIVASQQLISQHGQWPDIWEPAGIVFNNQRLQRDLRPEAGRIIFDYMSLYSEEPVLNPYLDKNKIVLRIGSPVIVVNEKTYQLDTGSQITPELTANRAFLPISPLIKMLGGIISWDGTEQKVTIVLDSQQIELWIGEKPPL